ncbi:hypothetical protein [Methylobacterium sp. J-070]|uniref:hypothetical protein n=1 Tax=Methylobacterium sp. J-070 TaxID=2836650 RepID=UPI001FB94E79|nr:hypothetical protein [Methylobacterium sp. J-070]MCJ2051698.1 hypothetical protein [Methylobacterium sp. J-070]
MTASLFPTGPIARSTSMPTASRKAMKQSPGNATTVVVDGRTGACEDRTVVADRFSNFLRSKYPIKTADNVAADTGLPVATVQRWLDRGSAPSLWALGKLIGAYDAEVLCAALESPPGWLVAAARQQERERLEREIAGLRARLDGGGR